MIVRYEQVAEEREKIDAEMASFPTWLKPLFKMIDERRRLGEEDAKPRQLVYKSGEFVSTADKSEALEKRMRNFFKKFPEAEVPYEMHERKVSELNGIYDESIKSNKRYEWTYNNAEIRLQGVCKDSDGWPLVSNQDGGGKDEAGSSTQVDEVDKGDEVEEKGGQIEEAAPNVGEVHHEEEGSDELEETCETEKPRCVEETVVEEEEEKDEEEKK